MSVTADGIVVAPVNQRDIQKALGVGSSVNNWNALITHSYINKWAKYKPFRHSTSGPATEQERRTARFGFNPAILASGEHFNKLAWDCICGVVRSTNNKGGLWEYLKPRGLSYNEHYREADFVDNRNQTNGYKHVTSIPITTSIFAASISRNEDIYELNTSTSSNLDVVLSAGGGANNIALWELLQNAYNTPGSTWRLRVEVFTDNGATHWYERSQQTIKAISDIISFGGETASVTIGTTVPFAGLPTNTGTIYYVVVALQQCDANGNPKPDDLDNGFGILPPWTAEQAESGLFPFLYKIKLVSFFDRKIKFDYGNQTIGWGQSRWFTYAASVFSGQYNSGQMWLTCQIERNRNALYFTKSTNSHSGNNINFGASSDGGQTIVELTPMTSRNPWTEANSIAIASTSSPNLYTTLNMAGSVLPAYERDKYFTLYIYTRQYSYGEDPTSKPWVISTTLTLHYTY